MGRPPKNKVEETVKDVVEAPQLTRIKVNWENIHTGNGGKLLQGMVVEINTELYRALKDISTTIKGHNIDAIKLVDSETALTHRIVLVNDSDVLLEV